LDKSLLISNENFNKNYRLPRERLYGMWESEITRKYSSFFQDPAGPDADSTLAPALVSGEGMIQLLRIEMGNKKGRAISDPAFMSQ
jgi:hypothetical protein